MLFAQGITYGQLYSSESINLRYLSCLLFCFFTCISTIHAQKLIDDITDFFEFELHSKERDSTHYTTKLVIAPVVSYEPSTSLGFGGGTKLLFKPKKAGKETRTSNIPISARYTLRNQFILTSDYDIFFPQEKYLLKGRTRFSGYPISYFGIGNQSLTEFKREVSFNQLSIEPLLLKRIIPNFFLGGGFRLLHTGGAKLQEGEEVMGSKQALLDSLNNFSLGVELAAVLDSRDNILNATDGTLFEFTHGIYDAFLGSERNYMLSKADFRKYFKVNPEKLDVLAFQLFTRLSWGESPVLDLPNLGGQALLRGYQEGRFRDQFAYFTQVEYRWQTFRRIGFVFFGGTGSVASQNETLQLKDLKYSLGSGIRLKIVESENLNIRFDYALGFGNENANNFYLGIAEAF